MPHLKTNLMTFQKNFLIVFLYLFLSSSQLFSQETRGLYVNDFKYIIGDPVEEDKLLNFVQTEKFNYLLLYNLYHIHKNYFDMTDAEASMPLANFIEKAKTMYGVEVVGGVGEKFTSFEKMELYNAAHEGFPKRQLDVFNLEFEFWNKNLFEGYYCTTYLEKNNLPCTKDGAYEFYIDQINQLAVLADEIDVKSETYIGKPDAEQCQMIGEKLDRVLVHYYKKKDTYNNGNSIYNYRKERISGLAPATGTLEILPIFSSRSMHMGPWLEFNPKEQAFDTWMYGQNGFEDQEGDWKEHIFVGGYQWYRYTDMFDYLNSGEPSDRQMKIENEVAVTSKRKTETSNIAVYPNPATDRLTIKTSTTLPKIYDAMGRVVWVGAQTDFVQLDVRNWRRGVYVIKTGEDARKFVLH